MNHNIVHNENNILSQCDAVEAAASIRSLLNSILVTPISASSTSSSVLLMVEPQPPTMDSVTTHQNPSTTNNGSNTMVYTNHNNSNSNNYYQRLQSYTTLHYFAKPIHLSPIVCAVTGWELILLPTTKSSSVTSSSSSSSSSSGKNQKEKKYMNILSLPVHTSVTDTDITTTDTTTAGISSLIDTTSRLRCQCCHAILTIYIPNTLSTIGKNELILQYQQQLYLSHSISCLFRKPSEYFINTSLLDPTPPTNTTISTTTSSNSNSSISTSTSTTNNTSTTTPTPPQQYSLVVPTLLSRAIQQHPLSSLELVEQIHPWFIFQQKFNRLYPYIHRMDVTSNDRSFILPDHIQYYNCTNHNNIISNSIMTSPSPPQRQKLLSLLVTYMLQQQPPTDAPLFDALATATTNATVPLPKLTTSREIQDAEIATALIILGWDLQEPATTGEDDDTDKDVTVSTTTRTNHHDQHHQRIASIQCIFCLSRHRLIHNETTALAPTHPDIDDDDDDDDDINHSKNKRPRTATTNTNTISSPTSSQWNQPYMAHRYYCPWVCGFPLIQRHVNTGNESDVTIQVEELTRYTPTFSLPLWQVVTNRLLLEAQKYQPWNESENENHVTSNNRNTANHTMIQNFLSVHQQLKSSISPLRYSDKGKSSVSSL